METHCAGVFSRAVVNPQSLPGYPGKARICSNAVPCNTGLLCVGCGSWHWPSHFEEWDHPCRLGLASRRQVLSCGSKKGAWDVTNRLQRSRNFMEIISCSALHAVSPYGLRILLRLSKTGCWFPVSSFVFMHIIWKKLLLLSRDLIQLIKKIKN